MTNKILSIVYVLISLAFSSHSQTYELKIDQILDQATKENPSLGVSIGFLDNGKTYYFHRGNISREPNARNVDSATVFEIASISKALTANLIGQAVWENKLKLNDFFELYLPSQYQPHPELKNKITISDLASHQSGLPDIDFRSLIANDAQQPTDAVTEEVLVEIFNHTDTLSDYGSYRYSTFGIVLLGQILEEIYQKPYEEIFEEKIMKPLGLQRTFLKNYTTPNITQSYTMEGGKQELFNWGVVAPAGLIKSSTKDMICYLGEVLDPDSKIGRAAILQELSFLKEDNIEVGLGQNIIRNGEHTVFVKTGDTLGQSSVMGYCRQDKWGLVIFMNQNNSRLRTQLFNQIYEVLTH